MFITPLADEIPSRRRQPAGLASLPSQLLTPLQQWHQRLGMPKARIEEIVQNGKPTGRYKATVEELPCQTLTLAPEVLEAYYAYNDALLEMSIHGDVAPDLDACYGRFHSKALRIAMLLASLAGQKRIARPHWAYAQEVTEQWRLMLHHLVDGAERDLPPTREAMLEDKIAHALDRRGTMTARELHQCIRGYASREISGALEGMTKAERLTVTTHGKTRLYAVPIDTVQPDASEEETKNEEIPF